MLVDLPEDWTEQWAKYAMGELKGKETMENKYNSLQEFVKQWEVKKK